MEEALTAAQRASTEGAAAAERLGARLEVAESRINSELAPLVAAVDDRVTREVSRASEEEGKLAAEVAALRAAPPAMSAEAGAALDRALAQLGLREAAVEAAVAQAGLRAREAEGNLAAEVAALRAAPPVMSVEAGAVLERSLTGGMAAAAREAAVATDSLRAEVTRTSGAYLRRWWQGVTVRIDRCQARLSR